MPHGWRRFGAFLATSAALIGTVVLVSGVVVGRFFEHRQLAHEEEHTARLVQTQARQHLAPHDFMAAAAAGAPTPFASFARELPAVFRIKVFDRAGRVVWSDEPRLIGQTFAGSPHLARALSGQVASVIEAPERSEHVYERGRGYVSEVYVPITLPAHPELLGVIETYTDVTGFVHDLRRAQRLIWQVTGALGLFLYAALALVVWQASRSEWRAIQRLADQNRELTLIQTVTRSIVQPLDAPRLAATVLESAGTALGLGWAVLYRATGQELVPVARWPVRAAEAPPGPDPLARDAWREREAVTRDGVVALPVSAGDDSGYVLVGQGPHRSTAHDTATQRVLEIVLHQTAIALANVELFTAVREAHQRLAAILAAVADRMVIVDASLRVVWMNPAAADAAGSTGGGRTCYEVLGVGADAGSCQACPALRTLAGGTVERGVRQLRQPDGQVRHLDLVTAPLRDVGGRVHQVLEVARDITELIEMEERLKQSSARLERSHVELMAKTGELEQANAALRQAQAQLVDQARLAAVGQLAVGLHHAILNPLAGILGAIHVLRTEGGTPAARAEALALAEVEIRKVEQLIRRLPGLPHATVAPYVGSTTMLDLDPARETGE